MRSFSVVIFTTLIASCDENPKHADNEGVASDTTSHEIVEMQSMQGQFNGSWFWFNSDSSNSFKLILHEKSDSIYGQYCAASNFGNRLDCAFDTVYNVKGSISDNSARVKFNSFYGATNGIALIVANNDTLLWEIDQFPENGDCFAPVSAKLVRKQLW